MVRSVSVTPYYRYPYMEGWQTLSYRSSSSSDALKIIEFSYKMPEEISGEGVNITSVYIHGYIRNNSTSSKRLHYAFLSTYPTWGIIPDLAVYDNQQVIADPFTAISGKGELKGGCSYDGTHIFTKYIRLMANGKNVVFLGITLPDNTTLDVNVSPENWVMDITYETLGNIPTTDKTTAKLGETVTTTLNRIISDSTTTLNYKIGETVIASEDVGTATTHAFTIPETAGSAFPNSATATMTVEAVTSQSGTEYGTLSTSFTVTLPEDAAPTANMSVSRVWSSSIPSASQIAAYVQKQAGASAAITGTAKYGASISSAKLSVEGSEYRADSTSATFTHLPFNGSGNIVLTATVTDTRGNTGTTSETVNVLPWSSPTIQAFAIQRATETGTIAIDGTCAQADATASVSSLKISDTEKNTLTFLIQYREIGSTDWISADAITATDISSTISGLLTNSGSVLDSFNDMSGYEFRLGVSDLYATSYASDQMPTKEQFWDVDEATGKMGFGGDAPTSEETAGYTFYKPAEFKEGYKTYSTTEVDTGNKWIDGKTIYRLVVTTTTSAYGDNVKIGDVPSTIETLISCQAAAKYSATSWRPIPSPYYGNDYHTSRITIENNAVYADLGSSWNREKTIVVIIEYTKGATT